MSVTYVNVLGLDLSLTSTGYGFRREDGIVTGRITPNHLRGIDRLEFLRDQLNDILSEAILDHRAINLAVIEGYAMGYVNKKKGGGGPPAGRLFDIGEWGGVARLHLKDNGVGRIVVCSPSSLKMFATGNGGSAIKKSHVKAAIAELWGYDIENDDEADAFVLLMLGEAYANLNRVQRTYDRSRIRALDKLEIFGT